MKTAIGGTGLFTIVIVVLLLVTAYFCISINYTAAYKVSDSIIQQIQNDNGINTANIRQVLSETKYASSGKCNSGVDTGWKGIMANGTVVYGDDTAANYCIKKIKVPNSTDELPDMYYYRVKVFYSIDVPFFSSVPLDVKGDTEPLYTPEDTIENGHIGG